LLFLRCLHVKIALVKILLALWASVFILVLPQVAAAQGGNTLYGDLKVDESRVQGIKPETFHIILYDLRGQVIARQAIDNGGRYRFLDVPNGEYRLAVEVENEEVTRINIHLMEVLKTDVRYDLALEWQPRRNDLGRSQATTVAVVDAYSRTAVNEALFNKAKEALRKKDFDHAIEWLNQIVGNDPKDYLAWTELGTLHFRRATYDEAEKAYQRALAEKPTYTLALLNYGKLRLAKKEFEPAVEILSRAVTAQPLSADANYFLGEAYLQVKRGSKAVGYLNEALRLDPIGKAEAHLRLALLYKGAGLKDKAVAEYQQFLAKRPDYPEKEKIQQFIRENKKP
jgi:tetratricopeptide (TPR) repeat protein